MSVPYYTDDAVTVHHGDCLDVLAELPDASVDSVVTDPPYGLEFMGKEWDAPWKQGPDVHADARTLRADEMSEENKRRYIAAGVNRFVAGVPFQSWCQLWATECLRVLRPGGHLLAFGGTRTSHRLTCAIEDAGFEIRDSIAWLYGSGFPKSLDVSKAIDDARTWQGWGTALKPAHEPIVVARKPLVGTVAANVLAHGTGALNVDGCRIGGGGQLKWAQPRDMGYHGGTDAGPVAAGTNPAGRWPPNVALDEDQAAELDRQSGVLSSHDTTPGGDLASTHAGTGYNEGWAFTKRPPGRGDTGGASRFMFVAQDDPDVTNPDQPADFADLLDNYDPVPGLIARGVIADPAEDRPEEPDDVMFVAPIDNLPARFRYTAKAGTGERPRAVDVAHPTVKPLTLMRWLVRLVTPPGGLVLDPFAGSGTTAEACILERFRCITIEREPDYLPLIVARITKPLQVGLDFDGDGAA